MKRYLFFVLVQDLNTETYVNINAQSYPRYVLTYLISSGSISKKKRTYLILGEISWKCEEVCFPMLNDWWELNTYLIHYSSVGVIQSHVLYYFQNILSINVSIPYNINLLKSESFVDFLSFCLIFLDFQNFPWNNSNSHLISNIFCLRQFELLPFGVLFLIHKRKNQTT